MSDKPHVPRTDVVDAKLEKDKATYVPPALYPYRLRAPKKLKIIMKYMSCSKRLR